MALSRIEVTWVDTPDVLQLAGGPDATGWVAGLSSIDRLDAAHELEKAIVAAELEGTDTTPEVLQTYLSLGGVESQLDNAVLDEARLRRNFTQPIQPQGLAVVWGRLLRVQNDLSADEIRAWLGYDMVRALAMKSVMWSRFGAAALSDWVTKPVTSTTENNLALNLVTRHPREAATVLAKSTVGRDPAQLVQRLQGLPPKAFSELAATLVDERAVPVGLRIALAGRAEEPVRSRARAMVALELGTTHDALAELSPLARPAPPPERDGRGYLAAALLAGLGLGLLLGTILDLGLKLGFIVALIMVAVAWVSAPGKK